MARLSQRKKRGRSETLAVRRPQEAQKLKEAGSSTLSVESRQRTRQPKAGTRRRFHGFAAGAGALWALSLRTVCAGTRPARRPGASRCGRENRRASPVRNTGQGPMNKARNHTSNQERRSEGGSAAPGRLSEGEGRRVPRGKSHHPFETPSKLRRNPFEATRRQHASSTRAPGPAEAQFH